jgi:hypothetical protein
MIAVHKEEIPAAVPQPLVRYIGVRFKAFEHASPAAIERFLKATGFISPSSLHQEKDVLLAHHVNHAKKGWKVSLQIPTASFEAVVTQAYLLGVGRVSRRGSCWVNPVTGTSA